MLNNEKKSKKNHDKIALINHGSFKKLINNCSKLHQSKLCHIKMLKTGLQLVPGTKVIPFSSQTKQGRDEIWELIETEYLGYGNDEGAEDDKLAPILASCRKLAFQHSSNSRICTDRMENTWISHAVRSRINHCIYHHTGR